MALDLSSLNPEQRQAVTSTEGAVLVLAGAGSGKTRVITTRIEFLIKTRKVPPSAILAVTFTNKAAREMAARVAKVTKGIKERPLLSTFHALGVRLLKAHITLLGYRPGFIIFDSDDQTSLVKGLMEEQGVDTTLLTHKEVHFLIQKAKSENLPAEELMRRQDSPRDMLVGQMMARYQDNLKRLNAIDFEDILQLSLRICEEHPEEAQQFFAKFRYVMVDEYQDTNNVQYTLLRHMVSAHGNLCVVGDDDQSIYGWRGAEPGNIRAFTRDYPNTTVVRLERNYRSTGNILAAANQVISNNGERMEKTLRAVHEKGAKLEWLVGEEESEELDKVGTHLRLAKMRTGAGWGDFAILYRSNFQSRPVEEVLRLEGIPYQMVGSTRFYERREVKDALAYLRLVVNPLDEVCLHRVINFPRRGIGRTSVARLMDYAVHQNRPPMEIMAEATHYNDLDAAASRAMERFAQLLEGYRNALDGGQPFHVAFREMMEELNLRQALEKDRGGGDAGERAGGLITELVRAVDYFHERLPEAGPKEFLEHVALMTLPEEPESEQKIQQVTLMTVHSAKGLEFDHVYLVNLADDIFPHKRSLNEGGLEEERRLFYVAITRARKTLAFSMAKRRKRFGEIIPQQPSRFLSEIDGALFDGPAPGADAKANQEAREVKTKEAKNRFFEQMRNMRKNA